MSTPRNALGRGIGALIPNPPPPGGPRAGIPALDSSPRPSSGGTGELPVAAIERSPGQPRRRFDPAQLERLADSIRQHGVLQPVVVRRAGDRYQLVVGERRWRASQVAGLERIPAVIVDVDDRKQLDLALVENVQRHDLNPIELGLAFKTMGEGGATQEEIGKRVGLDRSTVANHIRLLDLPRDLQQDIEEGRISAGHAKALLGVENPERRRHLRDRVVKDGLSVRAAEELGRSVAAPQPARRRAARPEVDPNLQRLTDSLRQRLQTRVRIHGDAKRGRIELEFFGTEDLNRLAEMLLGDG
jgi:ParB family chromosome partitioning protein